MQQNKVIYFVILLLQPLGKTPKRELLDVRFSQMLPNGMDEGLFLFKTCMLSVVGLPR